MVAGQNIKLGPRHRGKIVTVVIEDTHLRVMHGEEEIAVRPRRNLKPITDSTSPAREPTAKTVKHLSMTTRQKCPESIHRQWVSVVEANMWAGYLDEGDPVITTGLILGMILWVSRWYRPKENITSAQIVEEAIRLLRLEYLPPSAGRNSNGQKRRPATRRDG